MLILTILQIRNYIFKKLYYPILTSLALTSIINARTSKPVAAKTQVRLKRHLVTVKLNVGENVNSCNFGLSNTDIQRCVKIYSRYSLYYNRYVKYHNHYLDIYAGCILTLRSTRFAISKM